MTPWGLQLKVARQTRGLTQGELSKFLRLPLRVVSALETGRRQPLQGSEFEKLVRVLHLDQAERARLTTAAACSAYSLRLPFTTTPRELELTHRLVRALPRMNPSKLDELARLLPAEELDMA